MMKTTRKKRRVLAKILSRHSTRDLPCKFPKQIYYSKSQSKRWKRKLNVQAQVKTRNGKSLKVKALVDSGCTHTRIDEQLVKDKRIQTKKINFSFEVFNRGS